MSVITFPASIGIASFSWEQQRRDVIFRSLFGNMAAVLGAPVWAVSFTTIALRNSEPVAGLLKATLLSLRGKQNKLEMWNYAQPYPNGTMRGAMTLNGAHAQGATTLNIVASGENGKTLLAGDLLGLGVGTTQQVVMLTADAVSNGSGQISCIVESPLRNAFSTGSGVSWNKPSALFRLSNSKISFDYARGQMMSGIAFDLIEDWR